MNSSASPTAPHTVTNTTIDEVVNFWRDAGPASWFRKDDAFDADFRQRFLPAHEAAARGELSGWSSTPDGNLALLILLDQFPRNAFRGTARMFATDADAVDVARTALVLAHDQQTEEALRNFFYLPFMHSEDLTDQNLAMQLTLPLSENAHKFAIIHRDIIAQFGRFPHRNGVLGRSTTAEEQAFLDKGGFAG